MTSANGRDLANCERRARADLIRLVAGSLGSDVIRNLLDHGGTFEESIEDATTAVFGIAMDCGVDRLFSDRDLEAVVVLVIARLIGPAAARPKAAKTRQRAAGARAARQAQARWQGSQDRLTPPRPSLGNRLGSHNAPAPSLAWPV